MHASFFNALCKLASLSSKAQLDVPTVSVHDLPDANKPSPSGNVIHAALLEFSAKLSSLVLKPGMSVNLDKIHELCNKLNTNVVSGNPQETLKTLRPILDELSDGGGSDLYKEGLALYNKVRAISAPKPNSTPSWLSSYMTNKPTGNWLDKYMDEEKAKQQDSEIKG